jgi:5-methylcytosine-specific restriction endonuclease McrA
MLLNKEFIYKRDNNICQYCGRKIYKYLNEKGSPYPDDGRTVDHIIPRCKGGKNSKDNVIACCYNCNGILKNKGYTKRVHENILMTYKLKKKIIKWATGQCLNKTPKFLIDNHKEFIIDIK